MITRLLFSILPILSAVALAAPYAVAQVSSPIKVAATLPILTDWIKVVGGRQVEAYAIMGEGADLHHFEPVPEDLRALGEADVIYEIGLGLEPWLDDLVRATRAPLKRVRLSDGLSRLPASTAEEDAHAHETHPWDPHIWMDPQRAAFMVVSISETLGDLRPASRQYFQQRTEDYILALGGARVQAARWIAEIPEARRKLVLQHRNLAYFAERFGLEILATVQHGVETEFFDPSARRVARLVELLRRENIPAIFPDYGDSPALMKRIAKEAGARLGPPLYVARFDASPDGPVRSYIEMIRYNAKTIRDALAPERVAE